MAYADFVTAMMALFLVLWILNQDEKIKGDVSSYFNTRFKSQTQQSVGIIPIQNADLIEAKRAIFDNQSAVPLEHVRRLNKDLIEAFVQNPEYIDMKTLRVQMTDEGLMLEFFNDPNRRLFESGNAELTEYGKLLFGIVAWTLAKHDAARDTSIEVEGHTHRGFRATTGDQNDDEWSVSTDRALKVRKLLEDEGVKEAQFHKMVGYGSNRPLADQVGNEEHPYHNRVSIMVRAGLRGN